MRTKGLYWLPVISALVFILYHLFAYLGHFGFDDLHYAELSSSLARGETDWNDHFSFRWTLLGLTALSYKLLGVGDTASSLPALAITLANMALIVRSLRKYSLPAVAAGLALFTLNHWTLFYADKLMPDVYVAFFGTAALLVYYDARGRETTAGLALLFALLLFGAFLSKETALLLAPLPGYWLVSDLARKKNRRFWGTALLAGSLLLAAYLLLTWHLTGNPLARMRAIVANQYVSFCDYAAQPFRELATRISWGLLQELTHQGMMAALPFLLPLFFLRRHPGFGEPLRFFATASLVLLLSANFMPISLFPYNPMCTEPRHYLFLIPPLSIAGALALDTFYDNRRYRLLFPAGVLFLSLLLLPIKSLNLWEQTLPLALPALAGLFAGRSRRTLPAALVLLALILAIKPARFAAYAREVNYPGQKRFLTTNVLEQKFDLIVTDDVQKRLIRYYAGFGEKSPAVANWEEAQALPEKGKAAIALVTNTYTQYLSGDQPGEQPYYATRPELAARPVVRDSLLGMSVFIAREWRPPVVMAAFSNGFEEPAALWTLADGRSDSTFAANGRRSNLPGEYSATFRISSDSLGIPLPERLLISCRLRFMTGSRTNASLVFSVGQNEGDDLWEAYPLFPQVKAFGSWSALSFHAVLDGTRIRPGSQISVYAWNPARDPIRTDDWEIVISALR